VPEAGLKSLLTALHLKERMTKDGKQSEGAWDPIKDGGYKDEADLRAAFDRRAKRRGGKDAAVKAIKEAEEKNS
jgi:hypothetical protein